MTACVNNDQKKEGSAYGKAVKATLAATLAVGMVPAVALAAEAPETEGDIALASVSPEASFAAGKVTAAQDNEGNAIADLAKVQFAADDKAHFVVPTEFTPEESIAIDVTDAKKFSFEYYALDKEGKKTGDAIASEKLVNPGMYGVVVKSADGAFESGIAATFTIGSASLADATLFEVGEEGDISDTTFVYSGAQIEMGVALNGKALASDQYEIAFYKKGDGTEVKAADLKDAGEYVAQVKGADTSIYKGQTKKFTFTVEKFDVSKATIVVDQTSLGKVGTAVTITTVDGEAALVSNLEAKVVAVPDSVYGGDGLGVYQVSVAPTKASESNITGTQTLSVAKYAKTATFKYGDQALGTKYDTDYSAEKPTVFDLSKIAAYDDGDKEIKDAKLNIVVKDAKGNIVDNSNVTKPGEWTVLVSLDPASTKYQYGGEAAAITVSVKDGDVTGDADVFVKYAGEVVDEKELDYTGEDLFKNVSVVVKVDDKVLVAGEDYEVALKKEVEGEYVAADAMIDAGKYQVTVTGKDYKFDNEQIIDFTVKPTTATGVKLATPTIDLGKGEVIPYTGEAIVPEFAFTTAKDPAAKDAEYIALPEGVYEIAKIELRDNKGNFNEVKEIKEAGIYKVTLADNEDDGNFVFGASCNKEVFVTVSDTPVYSDVPVNEWFTTYVYDASKAGYMLGIGGTDLFAPNKATSRAEAAMVLYRMAGNDSFGGNDPAFTNPFVDVNYGNPLTDDWFAEAVLWANDAGVVTGDTGLAERTFRPADNVTRQDFCLMMMRYANATGQGVALEPGEAAQILAAFPDADAVAGYAAEGVAWAVKNELFGGYGVLNPTADITRAEMAKMVTVFQPSAL